MMQVKYFLVFLLIFTIFSSLYSSDDYPLSKAAIQKIISDYVDGIKKIKDVPTPPVQVEKQLLDSAVKALKEDKFDTVISACQKVLKKNPGSVTANKLLGIAYFETGKSEQGRKLLDTALAGSNNDPLISSYLGNYFESRKDYKLAISFYYIANENEKDLISLEKIGKIYRDLKHYPEALIWFKKVKTLSPSEHIDYETALTYFYLKEMDFAKFILKDYLDTTTNPEIPALYAKILQLEGKYQETIDYLEKNSLDFSEKKLIIGVSYYKLKQDKEAVRNLEQYMKEKPDSYAAGLILANLYISKKQYDSAIALLKKLVLRHSDKYVLYIMMAESFLNSKNTEEAITSYEFAIAKTDNKAIKKEIRDLINDLKAQQSAVANSKIEDTPLSSSFSTVTSVQGSGGYRPVSSEQLQRINAHIRERSSKIYHKLIK